MADVHVDISLSHSIVSSSWNQRLRFAVSVQTIHVVNTNTFEKLRNGRKFIFTMVWNGLLHKQLLHDMA